MEINFFHSSFEEGWIRQQFSYLALSACGDRVVKAKFRWLISTTSHKSMKLTDYGG
jgi:hypothetical protein